MKARVLGKSRCSSNSEKWVPRMAAMKKKACVVSLSLLANVGVKGKFIYDPPYEIKNPIMVISWHITPCSLHIFFGRKVIVAIVTVVYKQGHLVVGFCLFLDFSAGPLALVHL